MLNMEFARQIRGTSMSEQIEIIEMLLHSLKTKIDTESKSTRKAFKTFHVRKFRLGKEVHADRDKMYSERGL